MTARKKGVSPAQAQRDSLTAEVQSRGRKPANIWLLWSAMNDKDLVLVGDLRADHFYACEGDPDIIAVTYNPDPIPLKVGDNVELLEFSARVTLQDNTTELRVVGPKRGKLDLLRMAAESSGAKFVHVTPAYLEPLSLRVRNWRWALAALFRCNRHPITNLENTISYFLSRHSQASVGEVFANLTRGDDEPLVSAAIFSLLSKRLIESDLDFHHWGLNTVLSKKGGDS
jgi:hypothetical protein